MFLPGSFGSKRMLPVRLTVYFDLTEGQQRKCQEIIAGIFRAGTLFDLIRISLINYKSY